MRDKAVEKAYIAVQGRLGGMSLDEFREATKNFEVVPIHYQGEIVGAMLACGKEVHCCVDPSLKGKWFGRVALQLISKIINEHGEAISRATTEDGHQILLAMGFIKDGEIYRSKRKWV